MYSVLIVKLAAIGDVIMSLSMLSAIRSKYGDCEITWVCGKGVAPLLSLFDIQHLIVVDEKKILTGSAFDKVREVLWLWNKIAFSKFDLVVTAHGDKRFRLLAFPVYSQRKIAFGDNQGRKIPVPGRYHGLEYARLIMGSDDNSKIEFTLPTVKKHNLPSNIIVNSKAALIVLAPGGAKNSMRDDACRRWPVEYYVLLAKSLLARGHEVIVTGAKSDSWVTPFFENLRVKNYIGKMDLPSLLSLFMSTDILITHDSGPLHLGILAGTKVIALFGPTMPSEKVPQSNNVSVLWKNFSLSCCPCYDGRSYADCDNNTCLKHITVDEVFNRVEEMLGNRD